MAARPEVPTVVVGVASAPEHLQLDKLSRALGTYLGANVECTEAANHLVAQALPREPAVDAAMRVELSRGRYQAGIAVWFTAGRVQLLLVLPRHPYQPATLLSVDHSAIPPLHLYRVLALKLRAQLQLLGLALEPPQTAGPPLEPATSSAAAASSAVPPAATAVARPMSRTGPWGVEFAAVAAFAWRWPYGMVGLTGACFYDAARWSLGLEGGLSLPRRRSLDPAVGRLWLGTLALRGEFKLLPPGARKLTVSLRATVGAVVFAARVTADGFPAQTRHHPAPVSDGAVVFAWRLTPHVELCAGLGVRFYLRRIEYTVAQRPFYESVPASPRLFSAVRFNW